MTERLINRSLMYHRFIPTAFVGTTVVARCTASRKSDTCGVDPLCAVPHEALAFNGRRNRSSTSIRFSDDSCRGFLRLSHVSVLPRRVLPLRWLCKSAYTPVYLYLSENSPRTLNGPMDINAIPQLQLFRNISAPGPKYVPSGPFRHAFQHQSSLGWGFAHASVLTVLSVPMLADSL